jgi:thioesterase III
MPESSEESSGGCDCGALLARRPGTPPVPDARAGAAKTGASTRGGCLSRLPWLGVYEHITGMPATSHEYPLLILERHLDTFGHVNNATYLEILEEARWDWITRGGYGLREIRTTGRGPTILECTIRFKREVTVREQIRVQTDLEAYRGKIAKVRQRIFNERGDIACEALFVMGLFDTHARKLVAPTAEWLASFGMTLEEWSEGETDSSEGVA